MKLWSLGYPSGAHGARNKWRVTSQTHDPRVRQLRLPLSWCEDIAPAIYLTDRTGHSAPVAVDGAQHSVASGTVTRAKRIRISIVVKFGRGKCVEAQCVQKQGSAHVHGLSGVLQYSRATGFELCV